MPFTGKCTYSAGATLPEIAEDVSDLVAINAPHDTPLLDAIGEAQRPARSTVHEWIEDSLLPDFDVVSDDTGGSSYVVSQASRFRVGDIVRIEGTSELTLVSAIDTETESITLTRGYGGTTQGALEIGAVLHILSNAALEGADADAARFTLRTRASNYTQIFTATVSVSGSELASNQLGVRDELAWQKNLRSRELLRDLEKSVINGVPNQTTPMGSASVRRSMRGLMSFVSSNRFVVGQDAFPNNTSLTESQLNLALREIWKSSNGQIDLIVVGGKEKRAINAFVASNRRFYASNESFKDQISTYESDFGVARIVLSRHVPAGCVLLLDSSRLSVMPLAGRSFHYTPLARTGDSESGQLVGEYTLECRNESAHGIISGFTA